jgi:hypothetical protein
MKLYNDYKETVPSKKLKVERYIGSASIVKMLVPDNILNELNIDPEIFSHIYLILTCAHNVVYYDL